MWEILLRLSSAIASFAATGEPALGEGDGNEGNGAFRWEKSEGPKRK